MTQPDKPRCETCWHWQRMGRRWGECQRGMTRNPLPMDYDELCGEHTPKETPDAR